MQELDNSAKNLLTQIRLAKTNDNQRKKIEGSSFNTFRVLNLRTKEEAHSRFISELLNPKGSHLKGETFLKLFVEEVNCFFKNKPEQEEVLEIDLTQTDFKNMLVKREHNLGRIDKKFETGGFVDIWCESNEKLILIENKIFAQDQLTQLKRYSKARTEKNPSLQPIILYLTLDGHLPKTFSTGPDPDFAFHCISYEEVVIPWLRKCIERSALDPVLRESLRQYKILVHSLTDKASGKLAKKFYDLLLFNYREAVTISLAFSEIQELKENQEHPESTILVEYEEEVEMLVKHLNDAVNHVGQLMVMELNNQIDNEKKFRFNWGYDSKKDGYHFGYEGGRLPEVDPPVSIKYEVENILRKTGKPITFKCIDRTGKAIPKTGKKAFIVLREVELTDKKQKAQLADTLVYFLEPNNRTKWAKEIALTINGIIDEVEKAQ